MDKVNQELLPFFITAPGESDILIFAVTVFLILIVLGFGAIYFTIQAIPDRLVEGTFLVDIIDVENAALIAEATARKRMRQDITGMDQATINNLVAGIMTDLMP